MDYLLEIAHRLLPRVRTIATQPDDDSSPPALVDLNRQGALVHAEQERRAAARAKAQASPGATPPPGAPPAPVTDEGSAADPRWAVKVGDARGVEILADVLARHPNQIQGWLEAAGDPDFYPEFLAYLIATVIESAQPKYRPRTAADVFGWLWTLVSRREFVALLRDRHQKVAAVLARTRSWAEAEQRFGADRPRPQGDAPGTGRPATMSMLGLEEAHERAQQVGTKMVERLKAAAVAVGFGGGHTARVRAVVDCLMSTTGQRDFFLARLRLELLADPALVLRLVETSGAAAPFGVAFAAELREVRKSRRRRLHTRDAVVARHAPAAAAEMRLFGVALSGGGIRSATFNLGILQGLAQLRLLRNVDYLSTVSGGGYIGGWLSAWAKRARLGTNGRTVRGVGALEEWLAAEPLPMPDDPAVRPVRFLREYSNYLTPATGFLSADTWTLVAIWLRNTLLNQSVLVLALASALLVPWVAWVAVSRDLSARPGDGLVAAFPIVLPLIALVLIVGAVVTGRQLRRFHLPPAQRAVVCQDMLGQGGVLLTIVVPVLAVAWLLAGVVLHASSQFAEPGVASRAAIELAILFFVCHVVIAVVGEYWRCFFTDRVAGTAGRWTRVLLTVWSAAIITLAGALSSVFGALLFTAAGALLAKANANASPPISWHWAVFGVPVVVAIFSLIVVVKLGILGRNLFDEHREWWSRVGAWLNIASLAWVALFGFGIYSPYLLAFAADPVGRYVAASGGLGWALWTGAGVLMAQGEDGGRLGAALKNPRLRRLIVALAPYVFIAGLLALVSTAAYWLVVGSSPLAPKAPLLDGRHWTSLGGTRTWLFAAPPGLLLLAFLLSFRVDVNEFSMHHFYKNRLVRCYLGASRTGRHAGAPRAPDPFTGFDPADDVKIADLRLVPGGADVQLRAAKRQSGNGGDGNLDPYVGPLPIVNVALNLVKGDDLAWQERKAQSFTFTPLFSGYDYQSRPGSAAVHRHFATEGFRPTLLYGYPPFGIGLGTAVAISGAAASPNMGYHSSPAAAFLMTMFNARLGWWMGNPRDKFNWLRSGPRRGLLYLLNELFGLTTDRTNFVSLSDGGHFENLGIYELVRRRCRYIVASDAEQDDGLTFNGLGNAIRKCRMDLGTEITLRATRIHPPSGGVHSAFHSVIGEISYPNGEVGTLLYLKASLTGDEPADVLEYKARQPAFPHHSTMGDQFFDESQFESYRKLGVHIARTALSVPLPPGGSLDDRFDRMRDYWYPANTGIAQHFATHAGHYDTLLERTRNQAGLQFLDPAFFPGAVPGAAGRDELFAGASLLDLMQRVFLDLDLEHDADHPHNAGWMMIFRGWLGQPAVQRAWAASRHQYGRRFQWFVDRL